MSGVVHMSRVQRVILIVMDGVGIGSAPDAADYGDSGSATLQNTAGLVGGLELPVLTALGLGRSADLTGLPIKGVPAAGHILGSYGIMQEVSPGKDTTTGHFEIAGLKLDAPFPTFPNGFPDEVIRSFSAMIGRGVLGNKAASGTVIIEELGVEHMRTGRPIVYTSADSVFQIAAHEDVIPVPELYEMCAHAREILDGQYRVARVIARPFTGTPGSFQRTAGRKDFSVAPPGPTILDILSKHSVQTVGVGKISDIFSGRGLAVSTHSRDTLQSLKDTIQHMENMRRGLIFTNCIDFDMLWGHRNDPRGYAKALVEFDRALGLLMQHLGKGDLLVVTADHGNDPTTSSTDHSREYVPLLVHCPGRDANADLGVRKGFYDVAATVCEALLGEVLTGNGVSFLHEAIGEE
jgi:phosphopentomutase